MALDSFLDRLVDAREATRLLSISVTTLYKFCRKGRLNRVKYGPRCTRFRMSEIQALIAGTGEKGVAQ